MIGLTLVGFGTSTPELVTSVQAALSGSPGIAYGNIVGSNIANILLILGTSALLTPILVTSRALRRDIGGMTALIAPTEVPGQIVRFDNLVMILVSVLLVALAYTGMGVRRWEGGLLVAAYVGYVAWLWP